MLEKLISIEDWTSKNLFQMALDLKRLRRFRLFSNPEESNSDFVFDQL
jgi:hypothetical protein